MKWTRDKVMGRVAKKKRETLNLDELEQEE